MQYNYNNKYIGSHGSVLNSEKKNIFLKNTFILHI